MKKILFQILALVTVIGTIWFGVSRGGLLEPKTAYAVGDLIINWGVPEGDPIFVVNNFAPGDSELRNVDVTNNASVVREVGVIGANLTGDPELAGQLEIVISKTGVDLYGGSTGIKTLTNFLADGTLASPIVLTNINAGQTVQFDFTVKFKESAGDEFQGKGVTLDITIGLTGTIFGLPAECSDFDLSNANLIMGTQKNDRLRGTSGNDVIFGLEGNDLIEGRGGRDCLIAGTGNDNVKGETGDDILLGQAGNDSLRGGTGDDAIVGEAGNDTMRGENGVDQLVGGAGNDNAHGGTGTDTCEAESEHACEV